MPIITMFNLLEIAIERFIVVKRQREKFFPVYTWLYTFQFIPGNNFKVIGYLARSFKNKTRLVVKSRNWTGTVMAGISFTNAK